MASKPWVDQVDAINQIMKDTASLYSLDAAVRGRPINQNRPRSLNNFTPPIELTMGVPPEVNGITALICTDHTPV
jgi:hypothetical protein